MKYLNKNGVASMLLVTTSLCSPALAQTFSGDEGIVNLDPIVLGSSKRGIDLQEWIGAGVAITGYDIEDQNLRTSHELFASIPGLQMKNYGGYNAQPTVMIRGIGTDRPEYENSVQIDLDGLALSESAMANFPLFDIEQAEVLRGPQSTLHGKNALGGIVSITSRRPTSEREAYSTLGYGSNGAYNIEQVFSGELVEGSLYSRLALKYEDSDGDVTNPATGDRFDGKRVFAGRWINVFEISDNLTADLQLQASRFKDNGMEAYTFLDGPDNAPTLNASNDPYVTAIDANSAVLRFTYDLENSEFVSVSTLSNSESISDGQFPFSMSGMLHNERKADAGSQEFRWASTGDQALDWVVGMYLSGSNRTESFDAAAAVLYDLDTQLEKRSASIFGEATYDVSPNLRVTGGARIAWDRAAITGDDTITIYGMPTNGQYTGEVSTTTISPKIGVAYDVSDNSSVYALVSHGYKPAGYNTVNTLTPAMFPGGTGPRPASEFQYDRETVINYEVGAKNTLLNGRLELNSAIYYQDWRDKQVLTMDALGNVSAGNAEQARSYGLEVDVRFDATDSLFINGGFGLGVSEFVEYVDDLGVDHSGKQVEFFPQFQGVLGVTYMVPGYDDRLSLTGNMRYTGTHYFDAANVSSQEGYVLFDASATYQISDNTSLTIWGKNLTNESYATYKLDDGFGAPTSVTGTMGDGRSIGISFTTSY